MLDWDFWFLIFLTIILCALALITHYLMVPGFIALCVWGGYKLFSGGDDNDQ